MQTLDHNKFHRFQQFKFMFKIGKEKSHFHQDFSLAGGNLVAGGHVRVGAIVAGHGREVNTPFPLDLDFRTALLKHDLVHVTAGDHTASGAGFIALGHGNFGVLKDHLLVDKFDLGGGFGGLRHVAHIRVGNGHGSGRSGRFANIRHGKALAAAGG